MPVFSPFCGLQNKKKIVVKGFAISSISWKGLWISGIQPSKIFITGIVLNDIKWSENRNKYMSCISTQCETLSWTSKKNKKVLQKKKPLKKTHAYGYNNFTSHKENKLIRHPGTYIGV